MKRSELLAPAVAWSGQTWAGRIDQCASMLFCHGYITGSVREKIGRKLVAECEAALRDSDGSPKGGDACGSVHDSAGPEDIANA